MENAELILEMPSTSQENITESNNNNVEQVSITKIFPTDKQIIEVYYRRY